MLRLTEGTLRLGRSSENELQLPVMSVSRHHASIEVRPGGQVLLTDMGSTNGTFRNGRRLEANQPVGLCDGDRIGFGPTMVLKFACPDACEERYQKELFERAVRDGLTGLYNRAFFLEQAQILGRTAARDSLGLALLMLDVDHFKRINDDHGHDAGDLVLREVAQVIRQSTRADDLVARYGGEEFVAAIPIATPDHASERAERIRRNLASKRILLGGKALRVTTSIGLSFSPPDRPRPIESLISAADAGLYLAKNAGRDRVVFRGEMPEAMPVTRTTVDYSTPQLDGSR
jgi:diguanylate cyclase (GGDEF)-like protein